MRKTNKKDKYFLITLLIILVICIIANILSYKNKLNFIERIYKDTTNNIVSIFVNKPKIEYKTTYEYEILKQEYEKLKQTMNIGDTLNDYDIIYASVINRNLNYFYDSLTINKGSNDKIEVNQAVTYQNYLIGKVTNVSNSTSTIRLITNNQTNNKISVKIKYKDTYLYGLLNKYIDGYYILEGVDGANNIEPNTLVLTTGLSDIFPANLIVGKVEYIKKDNFDLSNIIYVKPIINMDDLNYISILKRKV